MQERHVKNRVQRMKKIFLFLFLFNTSSFCMEIEPIEKKSNELTPFLMDAKYNTYSSTKILANHFNSTSNYLDRLPGDLRYKVSSYIAPGSPALEALLEKVTLKQDQAHELYRKFYAYSAVHSLPELIKTKENFELIEQEQKKHQKNITHITHRAQSIMNEQDTQKLIEFMGENTLNLETLEELRIESLHPKNARGQVFLHPVAEKIIEIRDISNNLKLLVDTQEKRAQISTALANRFRSGRTCCIINYGGVGLLTIGVVISLFYTHYPVDFWDMMDCEINQYNKCEDETNITSKAGCLNFLNWSEGLWACCNNYSNAYCQSWKHNYTQASPRANLRVWSPVMVAGSAFLLFQLMAFFITRSKYWAPVDQQIKNVIQRYDTKVEELQFEEV